MLMKRDRNEDMESKGRSIRIYKMIEKVYYLSVRNRSFVLGFLILIIWLLSSVLVVHNTIGRYDSVNTLIIETDSELSSISSGPNGRYVASSKKNGDGITVWSIKTLDPVLQLNNTTSQSIMVWHPNGEKLAGLYNDTTVSIWNINGTIDTVYNERERILDLKYSPNGEKLAILYSNDYIVLWSPEDGKTAFVNMSRCNCSISEVSWRSNNGFTIMTNGEIIIDYNLINDEMTMREMSFKPRMLQWNWRGDRIAIISGTLLRIYDEAYNEKNRYTVSNIITSVDWNNQGDIATGSENHDVIVWQNRYAHKSHNMRTSLYFSKGFMIEWLDYNKIATLSVKTIYVVDVSTVYWDPIMDEYVSLFYVILNIALIIYAKRIWNGIKGIQKEKRMSRKLGYPSYDLMREGNLLKASDFQDYRRITEGGFPDGIISRLSEWNRYDEYKTFVSRGLYNNNQKETVERYEKRTMHEYVSMLGNRDKNSVTKIMLFGFADMQSLKDAMERGFYNTELYYEYHIRLKWGSYIECVEDKKKGFESGMESEVARKLGLETVKDLEAYCKKHGDKTLKMRRKEFLDSIN